MTTKRKATTATKYQRYEYKQLATIIRNWNKKYVSFAKTPAWKTIQGWTPAQIRAAYKREIAIAVLILRAKALKEVDARLQTLKSQVAKGCGISISSPKCTSTAIRRLVAKRRQISASSTAPALVTLCTGFKATSYKNPTNSYKGTTSYTTSAKTKKTKKTKNTSYGVTSTVVATKYKKQTKTLKKEIQKLKQRNSFMKSQVAKFRKEAAQLQRHYGTFNNQAPAKLRVITSRQVNKDVSNIVRFSNALNSAVQKQRKAS